MRLVNLFTDNPVIGLVPGHEGHPNAVLYRTSWIAGRPLRTECRDGDIIVTLEARPVSPTDTPPVDRMMVYKEPGTDGMSLIHQRIGAYGIVLSKRGLLGTVVFRFTGAPGAWNLPGGGLSTGKEPTAGLLREVHEETGQQIVPRRLLTLQSNRWVGRAPNGGLEDYHILHIICSATCERPNHPRVHNLGGSTARVD